MGATVVATQGFTFADGNGGHACVFSAGAPSVGDYDLLFANSDTVISVPSGFTDELHALSGQDAHAFLRLAVGGESDTVTITTSGNFNAAVDWWRVRGATGVDVAVKAVVDGVLGTATPAVSTGTLAGNSDLVAVAALLHSASSAAPVTPVWSSGFTAVDTVSLGTGGNCVVQFSAVKNPAGTASESPSVSWTNSIADRYIFVVAFTASASASATDSLTLADAATGHVALPRSVADSLGQADTATGHVALPRSVADALGHADAVTRTVALPRPVSDAVGLADVATARVTLTRSVSDSLTLADVVTRAVALPRPVTDALSLADVANATGAARTLVLTFGAPQSKWMFGTLRTTNGPAAGGGTVIQSVLSTDDVQVPVSAFVAGTAVNPSSDLVEMAFTTVGNNPGSGDWHTGSWDTAPGGTYLAQCLVGPGAGGVSLGRGIYAVWVRITDNPTIPVVPAGQLQIV